MTAEREVIERDLEEFLEGESWPVPDDAGTPQPIADERAAQGVMRRVKNLTRERAKIIDVAEAELSRIFLWRDDRIGGIDREIAFGEQALEAFARSWAEGKASGKGLKLPDGRLTLTKTVPHVEVVDRDAFMEWAVDDWIDGVDNDSISVTVKQPDYVKVTIEPDKSALRTARAGVEFNIDGVIHHSLATDDGEVIPGVELQRDAADRFGAKPIDEQ
jgi:hypothetical protein